MRAILVALALLGASVANGIQVIYGRTFGTSGVTIEAVDTYGGATTYAVSDSGGNYAIYVTNNFSGTIQPYTNQVPMVPLSYSVSALAASFRADFTAGLTSVSGYIYNTNGVPLPGVPVDFSGADSFTVISTAVGFYGAQLSNGWTGTVTPAPMFGTNFAPVNVSVSGLTSNYVKSFVLGGEWIGGMVTNIFTGLGVDGVTVTAGGLSMATTNGGNYGFLLPAGHSYTVTPSYVYGYFTPSSTVYSATAQVITNGSFAQSILFPVVAGRITQYPLAHTGVANVPVKFSDGVTVFADAYGFYSHSVTSGWSGTVTPTAPPLVFQPASRAFTNLAKNTSNRDFVWVPPGMTYQAPLDFRTNRFALPKVQYTLCRDDQVTNAARGTYIVPGTLRTNLALIDSEIQRIVDDITFGRAYTDAIDPSAAWAPANVRSLWGGFIIAKNLWANYDAEWTNVLAYGEVRSSAFEAGALSSATRQMLFNYYDAAIRDLVSAPGLWAVAPAYTAEVAGVYSIDLGVRASLVTGSLSNYAAGLVLGIGRDPAAVRRIGGSITATSSPIGTFVPLPPMSVRGTIYLDAGMAVYPYLQVSSGDTIAVTGTVSAVESVRWLPVDGALNLWE